VELFDNMNELDEKNERDTYQSTLLPSEEKGGRWDKIRTFTIYPQEGAICFPFLCRFE
jgi:hypothetical protein